VRWLLVVLAVAMFAPATVFAGQCDFDPTFDAKVFSYTYPAGVGLDFAVFRFEVGVADYGARGCVGAEVDTLGLLRLIPWVKDLLPTAAEPLAPIEIALSRRAAMSGLPMPDT